MKNGTYPMYNCDYAVTQVAEMKILKIDETALANVTNIDMKNCIYSKDIGPGNCLIDEWIRKKTKKKI